MGKRGPTRYSDELTTHIIAYTKDAETLDKLGFNRETKAETLRELLRRYIELHNRIFDLEERALNGERMLAEFEDQEFNDPGCTKRHYDQQESEMRQHVPNYSSRMNLRKHTRTTMTAVVEFWRKHGDKEACERFLNALKEFPEIKENLQEKTN